MGNRNKSKSKKQANGNQQSKQQEPPSKKNKTEQVADLSQESDENSSDTTIISYPVINNVSSSNDIVMKVVSIDDFNQQKKLCENTVEKVASLEQNITSILASYNQKNEQSSKLMATQITNLEKASKEFERITQTRSENEKLKKEATTHLKEIEELKTKLQRLMQAEQRKNELEKENSTLKEQLKSINGKLNGVESEKENLEQENKTLLSKELEQRESIRLKDMEILSLKNRKEFQVSDSKTEQLLAEMRRISDNSNDLIFNLALDINEDEEISKWFQIILSTVINRSCQLSEDELREATFEKSYSKAWQEFSCLLGEKPQLYAKTKGNTAFQSTFQELVKSSCRIVDICEKSTVPKLKRDWSSPSDKMCIAPAVVIETETKRVVVVEGNHVEKPSK